MQHAIIYAQKCRMGDILLGEEERMRLARMTRVGGGCERFTRRRTRRNTLRSRASLFWVSVSVAHIDWDSAKSLKSTRGCRSIATVDGGADDKWGNGQLAESFPPFTSIARASLRLYPPRRVGGSSLVLIPGNYKLFVISWRGLGRK